MSKLIETEEEWKNIQRNYNPQTDDRLLYTINKRNYIVYPGDFIKNSNGSFVQYFGTVENENEIPDTLYCLYRIGTRVSTHYAKLKKPEKFEKKEIEEPDESRLLDTTVKENDQELMVLMKETLGKITINQFKKMFTDVSEMNNIRREIEHGHNCSWNRLTHIVSKLGGSYDVIIRLPNGNTISID